jgi:hypothetical protein
MLHFRRFIARALLCVSGLGYFACGEAQGPVAETEGSETHFLTSCDDDCGPGADCLCGVCTRSCGESAACTALGADAACVALAPRIEQGRCAPTEAIAMCDVGCLSPDDCASLGDDYRCERGYCRAGAPSPQPEPRVCEGDRLVGRDVVVIGDALIELSVFTAELEQRATAAGVLAAGDHFRDYATALMSVLAGGSLGLANQWTDARAEGAARVVIMDGGATDLLNLPCGANPAPDCPALIAAVNGAESLLAAFAEASVEDVVYFFYADPPDNPELKASLDALRPLIENACGRSGLGCHFLDLRPLFAGHPEYLNADVVFLEPGAVVAAEAVWTLMQDRCVGR